MKKNKLIKKLNDLTGNEFEFLRLSSISVVTQKGNEKFVFNFIHAKEHAVSEENTELIVETIKKILQTKVKIEVNFDIVTFQKSGFLGKFKEYLECHPSLMTAISDKDIIVDDKVTPKKVSVSVPPYILDYANENKIDKQIKEFLLGNYSEEIEFSFLSDAKKEESLDDFAPDVGNLSSLEDSTSGRTIKVDDIRILCGKKIEELPSYIEDANKVGPVVICGTLTSFSSHTSQNDKKYCRMTIEDFTGSIGGMFFPRKDAIEKADSLKTGEQVLVKGELQADKRNEGGKVFFINDISLCSLPKDFKVNRMKMAVPEKYKFVFPQRFLEPIDERSLLSDFASIAPVPKELKQNEFCVFDLETTGLDPKTNKIVEIAGVRVKDGEIVETFSTLIDPEFPIPSESTKIHGITNDMVKGMPTLEQVLPDFYKFSFGTTLVAQNIGFDLSFIKHHGKPLNIYFDNPTQDTLTLAHKYLKGLTNYKLGTIAAHLGIPLTNAHRALDDTIATAQVFLKIMKR
ncbi:MAG: exonuclease domain-containing protein [Firmicutes bacterium]|nr:exonuclease domain-containing protein [Bacillota bacterium]MCL2255937.1 exonuclease domain-containing protein [Bacillota bacterium]